MTVEILPPTATRDQFLQVERTGIEAIPSDERHTRPWELGGIWAGAFMNYISLLTGSLLVTFGLGIGDALTAIAVGAGLAGLVLGLVSVSGLRGGVPQIVFSRVIFGYRGAYLAGVLTLFLAVGWFAVDCVVATDALIQLAGLLGAADTTILRAILLAAVVGVSVIVAIYGHRTLTIFERYGAIIFLLFCAVLFALLAPKIHWSMGTSLHGSAHLGAWILGAGVTFALVASWFSFAADYSRYLPAGANSRAVVGWVWSGSALPTAGLAALGVLLFSINTKSGDLLTTIVGASPRPLTVAFLLFVALGMIWANYLDVYTAGLCALALDVRLPRWRTALLAGVLGGTLALYALFVTSFDQAYTNFLLVTYIWAPAWAAIVLLSLFVFRRQDFAPSAFTQRTGVSLPAILALLAGTASAIPFVNSSLWASSIAVNLLHGADLSGLISFVVGGAVYALLRTLVHPQS